MFGFFDKIQADLPTDEKSYVAAEIHAQDTFGPAVANFFYPGAGVGATFVQKNLPRYVDREGQIAISNPGVGIPILVGKAFKWL